MQDTFGNMEDSAILLVKGKEHCANSYWGVFTNVKGAKVESMLY